MDRENKTGSRIIAIAVILALIAAIIAIFWMNHKRTLERAEQYGQKNDQGSHERTQSKTQGKQALEYLEENLITSDFVVWGDRLAAGTGNEGSPSESLQNIINDQLINSIADELVTAEVLSRPSSLWIQAHDMGVVNEGMSEIKARAGTKKVMTGSDLPLPEVADYRYLDLDIVDENGKLQLFAKQRKAEIGAVTIMGIKGHLYDGSVWYDSKHAKLAFARDKSGEEITIPAGTEMHLESAIKYREYTPIIMFEDDGEAGFDISHIGELEGILKRHYTVKGFNDQGSYYVVVCATESGSDMDAELRKRFGDHYLREEPDIDDMTEEEYDKLASRIYDCLDSQGRFEQVRDAVEEAENILNATSE